MLVTAILWTHAIAGAAWVGASACFVIAELALAAGSAEQRHFAERGAIRIGQFTIAAAVVVAFTGVINLVAVLAAWRGGPSVQFIIILMIKAVLYVLMVVALGWALRCAAAMHSDLSHGRTGVAPKALRSMSGAHTAMLVMGLFALALGLWLMGS